MHQPINYGLRHYLWILLTLSGCDSIECLELELRYYIEP